MRPSSTVRKAKALRFPARRTTARAVRAQAPLRSLSSLAMRRRLRLCSWLGKREASGDEVTSDRRPVKLPDARWPSPRRGRLSGQPGRGRADEPTSRQRTPVDATTRHAGWTVALEAAPGARAARLTNKQTNKARPLYFLSSLQIFIRVYALHHDLRRNAGPRSGQRPGKRCTVYGCVNGPSCLERLARFIW